MQRDAGRRQFQRQCRPNAGGGARDQNALIPCHDMIIAWVAVRRAADRTPGMATIASMTGFARTEGSVAGLAWAWELRSVNGRGLDLRFRLPPGFDALEPVLREAAGKRLKRGNVTANLTVKREEQARLVVDPVALDQ